MRPDYHPGATEIRKDLSAPALVFDERATWYFEDEPKLLPDHLLHLAAGGQGHRVNGVHEGDIDALSAWLADLGAIGIIGKPRHGVMTRRLSRGYGKSKCG